MFNQQLTTFVTVTDCGSFTKAAEILFITPTAVMKQINALESHLNLQLIERSKHGIRLTPAGDAIYKDAKFLFDYSKRSIENARRMMEHEDKTFRVGTSMLNPAKPFMDLWYRVNQDFQDYKLRLVTFEDNHEGILSEIMQLGIKFDFLVAVCDSRQWLSKCGMLPLGNYKKMIAVSQEHRLAKKSMITIEDLYGETLMMVKEGDSPANDLIRNDLRKNHPAIRIEDTPNFYDISVFNRCIETGNVLLTIECWQDIHPALISIPVDWDYCIPYGLLYTKEPSADVLRFVDAVRHILNVVG
ncbi:LysR family transcriptional regulator [Enterocloster bolteae]|uniref:LysR family transcriptional regulator n=1 Tax=Enterocloster bolteae TaxID=208479 RepID=UPI0028DB2A27|nr:LysR family transcriptional regulator [Enterocloster bolteae]